MKIIQEHQKCIGCGSCVALCPKYWELNNEGKAKPISSKIDSKGNYELEIEEISCNKDAAEACPVQCIHVES